MTLLLVIFSLALAALREQNKESRFLIYFLLAWGWKVLPGRGFRPEFWLLLERGFALLTK
jgi:hypothetical protein